MTDQERYHEYILRRTKESDELNNLKEYTYPKWDFRFLKLAKEISTWSKDPSSKIGAVIVNDERRILATGYNGFPRGIADTPERLNDREEKYPRIIHAEMNALMNALYSGVSVKGATLYVYGLPVCSDCTKSVIQSGIKRIVLSPPELAPEKWREAWEKMSEPMFREARVDISKIIFD
jgi:dCMP deaminase